MHSKSTDRTWAIAAAMLAATVMLAPRAGAVPLDRNSSQAAASVPAETGDASAADDKNSEATVMALARSWNGDIAAILGPRTAGFHFAGGAGGGMRVIGSGAAPRHGVSSPYAGASAGDVTLGGGNGFAPRGSTIFGPIPNGSSTVTGDVHNQGTVHGATGGAVTNFAGTVNGSGVYTGNVAFSGTFSPGNSPAHVTGDNMIFDGSLVMELGGTSREDPTEYDSIDLTGTATLGGDLDVRLIAWPHDGAVFAPEAGDTFDILRAGLFTGAFAHILFPELDGAHFEWQTLVADGMYDFRLTVVSDPVATVVATRTLPDAIAAVPEPAPLAALGAGILLFLLWRRRRA